MTDTYRQSLICALSNADGYLSPEEIAEALYGMNEFAETHGVQKAIIAGYARLVSATTRKFDATLSQPAASGDDNPF